MGIRQDIERFHLLFCKSLLTTRDKTLIVLKGGCNLRFFLGSNRYSEDIDFDVETIAKDTLRKRVDKVLTSHSMMTSLSAAKIELASYSAPKQTDTIQRWKVMLRLRGLDVPSKIEFSRRGIDRKGTAYEPIDPIVLAEHRLTPTFMAHYDTAHAIRQKSDALAGRTETQARDIYDLGHLFSRNTQRLPTLPSSTATKAIECAMSVDFDQFRGQVVEFLEGDAKDYYSKASAWKSLHAQVIAALESLME
jgi:predicted nucleotidyltransferase component of viral defense system